MESEWFFNLDFFCLFTLLLLLSCPWWLPSKINNFLLLFLIENLIASSFLYLIQNLKGELYQKKFEDGVYKKGTNRRVSFEFNCVRAQGRTH